MGWKDMVDAMRQVIPFPGARVPRPVDPARALLDAFYAGDGNLAGPEAAPLLEASPELRASALVLAFEDTASTDYRLAYLGQSIGLRLARARLPLTDDHLVRLASVW
ncbi:MAG: hypothetical protein KC656_16665, partial [Myxococcales bacterium]|nr:hypothetical protein [Myxococcales bacterium]